MNNPESERPSPTGSNSFAELNEAYRRAVAEQHQRLPAEEAAFRQLDLAGNRRGSGPTPGTRTVRTKPPLSQYLAYNIRHLRQGFRKNQKLILAASASSLLIICGWSLAVIAVPQKIGFSFSKLQNCEVSLALFPELTNYKAPATFSARRVPALSLGHVAIFSAHLCVEPAASPQPKTTYDDRQLFSLLGLHISKTLHVKTADYPSISTVGLSAAKSQALPLIEPLQFKLAARDAVFNYALSANNKTAPCTEKGESLSCNLMPLSLSYSAHYQIGVVREFKKQVASKALDISAQTIDAAGIAQASIAANSTVYSVPQQITLQTNKPLDSVQGIELRYTANGKPVQVPVKSTFQGTTITVTIAGTLPRETTFNLAISNVTAKDQSQLEQAYNLSFTTSGGPSVTGENLPSFGVASGQTIVLSFSQPLLASQDASTIASLQANGAAVPASYSISGNQIIIRPTGTYPVCAHITVQTNNNAQSNYGIGGNSAYSFSTTSHCYLIFSIGTSVQGRAITGYKFGSGPSQVLFIGAMEGNEQNSSNLLSQWIPNIDANPGKIPSYRTVVVIPTINPDGYAADTRLNADGIDLNRNFPANNWQQQVTEPLAPNTWTNDGGPEPLSEPESQALANYYQANRPRLTMTMHSHGGIVEANDAGDSIALGQQYASLADYRAIPTYAIGNFFNYTTTGAFEDWANDKLGLPVLEVELESPTSDEYSRNLSALWAMAQVSQ